MSGGAYEFVESYVNNENSYLDKGSPFATKDTTAATSSYKKTSWFGDYSIFIYSISLFLIRGGYYGEGAGVFYLNACDGVADSYYGFHPVLTVF